MAVESEIKFSVQELNPILEQISRFNCICSEWYLERNLVLDSDSGQLRKRDILLRIRQGLTNKIALKLPVRKTGSLCKQQEEVETGISDPEAMKVILAQLGFRVWLRYEKFRKVCLWKNVKICLDILPFGLFIELEGPEEMLFNVAGDMGLDPGQSIVRTYHELHQDYLQKMGMSPDSDFVFTPQGKKAIAQKLNVKL